MLADNLRCGFELRVNWGRSEGNALSTEHWACCNNPESNMIQNQQIQYLKIKCLANKSSENIQSKRLSFTLQIPLQILD